MGINGGGMYKGALRSAGRLLKRLVFPGAPAARSRSDRRTAAGSGVLYAPRPDGKPDPGEIVWAWVPYEDDPAQGKDRPVLLIGRDGNRLLALPLTTRDRNNASSKDRRYVDIGTGAWDRKGRPSEVNVDRVIRLEPSTIRRNGAVLHRAAFDAVLDAMRRR